MRTFTQQLPDTGGFIFRMLLACFLVGGTVLTARAATLTVCNSGCDHATIGAAIAAASNLDVIQLNGPIMEGLVTINKEVTLEGQSNTLTSSSASWGLAIRANNVTVQNLTVTMAGTFGIHTLDADDLTLTNISTINNGGTGIALNCSVDQFLTDITSTGNGGNGITVTNTSNVTITNITTSGNEFGSSGFGAGVAVSNTNKFCVAEATSSNVSIGGVVMIAEVPAFYEEADNSGPGAPVVAPDDTDLDLSDPGSVTTPSNFFAEFSGGTFGSFGYPDLDGAIQFAGGVIFQDQNSGSPTNVENILTVRNAAGDAFYVKTTDFGGGAIGKMELLPAVNLLPTGTPSTLDIGAGTYAGNIDLSTKQVTIRLVD